MASELKDVILEPIITEKSTALAAHSKYTFKVAKNASKFQIKQAFEQIFPKRKVLSIQTAKITGHTKRTKKGIKLLLGAKKAVVSVEGDRIEYFPESAS